MPKTSAWERHCRRRDVIRLRYGKGFTVAEIAEELGWSEATIGRDLERIRDEVSRMGDPDVVRKQILTSIWHLIGHEYDDLHRAEMKGNERAKHRAKTSFRKTVTKLAEFYRELDAEPDAVPVDSFIEDLPTEAREAVDQAAKQEVEGILRS